jgi:membrane protein
MLDALRERGTRLHRLVWETPREQRSWAGHQFAGLARLAVGVGRDFASGALSLRAMGLVFTSMLAIVPLLAVSFSVLKGFGVHNQLEPALDRLLAPLGPKADEVTQRIVGFVDNIQVEVLGALGIATFMFTAISLVQRVEEALNYTWNVRRQRNLGRRFSDYFSVIVVGPLLIFLALGMTASLTNSAIAQALIEIPPFGVLLAIAGGLAPYVLVSAAFTFIYLVMPNTRVQLGPALFGGIVGGVVWQALGKLFATFVATSAKYTIVYSGFAILLVFIIWLNLAWHILLTGSLIAFYRQHPEYLLAGGRDRVQLSGEQEERLALALVAAVVQDWYAEAPAPDRDALARRLRVPGPPVDRVLNAMLGAGLLAASDSDSDSGSGGFLPGVPPERTPVKRVLDAMRMHGRLPHVLGGERGVEAQTMATVDSAVAAALGGTSITDLAQRELAATQPLALVGGGVGAARADGPARAEDPGESRR